MSKFYLPSTSVSATSTPAHTFSPDRYPSDNDYDYDDDDDLDTLPYPAELKRNDFLAPDFDAQTYLSSLRNRHQTLEDLRSDLRQRSQLLNKELLDLVNGNYEDFLSLGGDLKGGEEKVEGVRVGLLGFEREIQTIQRAVQRRLHETTTLLQQKKALRQDVVLGRNLLDIDSKISQLEEALKITEVAEDEGDEGDEDDSDGFEGMSSEGKSAIFHSRKLRKNVERYTLITRLVDKVGPSHSFIQAQRSRLIELRRTLLLDLAAALRFARTTKNADTLLEIVKLHGDMHAEAEGVKILNS